MTEKTARNLRVFSLLSALLLVIAIFTGASTLQVKGDWSWTETIYIRENGNIEPNNAPISTLDKVTYELTENIVGNILGNSVVFIERTNVVLDGKGYSIQFTSQKTDTYPIGISIAGNGENVTIKNFEIRGFMFGIKSDTNDSPLINNRISSNILANNSYGILLSNSGSNNEIIENQITHNGVGLAIQKNWYNLVSNNTIMNNLKGIDLGSNASYNEIIENRIENNGWSYENGCGVELSGAPWAIKNIFYHNDFINNRKQIFLYSNNINYWDNGFTQGGNYWSDYRGFDLCSGVFQNETCRDGIGDTTYVIDENNRDSYPLLNPWNEHLSPPVARFEHAPEIVYALQDVFFDSSFSYDLDQNIVTFSWDFGDGNTTLTTSLTINHTFSLPGQYFINLTVFDEKGLSNTYSRSIRVIAASSISVITISKVTSVGFAVDINGTLLSMFQEPLENQLVMLSYTFEGAGKWFPITSAITNNLGEFWVVWVPTATGQYSLRTEWDGNETYAPTLKTTNLNILFENEEYLFGVESNSTISSLSFDSKRQELRFITTGESGTTGYVRITISKTLIDKINSVEIRIDNNKVDYTSTSIDDSWLVFVTFPHSNHDFIIQLGSSPIDGSELLNFLLIGIILSIVIVVIIYFIIRRRK
ncbi:NosD domain-containing protein [Thermoproteota archaeon]